ncbi:MAG: hypothetical protein P1V36_13860 [Planctomycetota bacterium]|nr:hypothetical protein [Planctomycetota bacterium]
MEVQQVTRRASSMKKLETILAGVEAGTDPKPDWIELGGKLDPSKLSTEDLAALMKRMHGAVLRGFRANDVRTKGKRHLLEYWTTIAQHGFHDFAEDQWMKCYDSPFVENYDYITPYLDGGLDALDPYMVYSSVLGTWEYSVEDFVQTELGSSVQTIVEPLAGTAEFCYAGHFRHPDFNYVMFDVDEDAKKHVEAKPWLEQTQREFIIGDALEESTWEAVRAASKGTSLAYIGKQSQNFFKVKDLLQILEWGTKHVDHLMLEVSEPYLLDDEPSIDELSRAEHKAAGFKVALEDVDDISPNPLTNRLDFYLVAWDKQDRRNLFSYCDWVGWQAPTLTALGRLLDLEVRYYHDDDLEFMPVDVGTETSECRSNNTFMLFSRR